MREGVGDARILVPERIKQGDLIDVRALISHPMDTGLFRDQDNNPIPAHFIDDVAVVYGGRQVAHFVWTSGISRDPYVQFPLRADREGALVMTWKDNLGAVFSHTVDITFV